MKYLKLACIVSAVSMIFWGGYNLGATELSEPPNPYRSEAENGGGMPPFEPLRHYEPLTDSQCDAIKATPVEEEDIALKEYVLKRQGCQ